MAVQSILISSPTISGWKIYRITCQDCDNPFDTTNPGAPRCKSCAKAHRRAYLRSYRQQQRQHGQQQ